MSSQERAYLPHGLFLSLCALGLLRTVGQTGTGSGLQGQNASGQWTSSALTRVRVVKPDE